MSITLWYTATLSFILIKFIYWFVFYPTSIWYHGRIPFSYWLKIKKISCTAKPKTIYSYVKSSFSRGDRVSLSNTAIRRTMTVTFFTRNPKLYNLYCAHITILMTKNGRFWYKPEHMVITAYKISPHIFGECCSDTVLGPCKNMIKDMVQKAWIALSVELSSETNDPTPTQTFTDRISTMLKMSTKSSKIRVKASL